VPFIATGSTSIAVPFPAGDTPSNVFINDAGQIAGYTIISGTPNLAPYIGTAAGVALVPLPPPTALGGATVAGFNDLGEIVGSMAVSGGLQAFVGTSAGITLLPYLTGDGINGLGQILVESQTQTFILTGGNAVIVPGAPPEFASGLNNADQVVGGFGQAFVAYNGGITLIPPPAGYSGQGAYINDEGIVVGNARPMGPGNDVGFIWDPVNGTQLVSSLLPPGWTILGADGINDSGQIIAYGSLTAPGSPSASFTGPIILTPLATPEPGTLSMMFAAMIVAGVLQIVRKRKPTTIP
jgi:hypothetical protein